jgi:hypothetical protein
LRATDLSLLDSLLWKHNAEVTDSVAKAVCDSLNNHFRRLFNQGKVFRGNPDVSDREVGSSAESSVESIFWRLAVTRPA